MGMFIAYYKKPAVTRRRGKVKNFGTYFTVVSSLSQPSPLVYPRAANHDVVFRGCVALSYPDTWHGGRDPLTEDITLQEETIPLVDGQPANQDGTVVHFDIEPQNGEV